MASAVAFSKKDVMRHYDAIAGMYSESHNRSYYRWRRDKVLEFADLGGKTLLDVGCGSGTFLNDGLVSGSTRIAVGLDISGKILGHAAKNSKKAFFVQGDSESLPFGGRSFDVVTSLDALEHTPDPLKSLDELCRVSKGKIVVATPNAAIADPVFAFLEAFRLKMPEGKHAMVGRNEILKRLERNGWKARTSTVALGLCIVYLAERA